MIVASSDNYVDHFFGGFKVNRDTSTQMAYRVALPRDLTSAQREQKRRGIAVCGPTDSTMLRPLCLLHSCLPFVGPRFEVPLASTKRHACQYRKVSLLTDSGPLGNLFKLPLPTHLYHYTGPAGVIGILKSRALWAGRPADMNDSTEQTLAHEYATGFLRSLRFPPRSFGEGMVEYALELLDRAGRFFFEVSRAYTVSLTSERDSLEQWRAYCPRSGGVALGFSAEHLSNVAAGQAFILVSCVYERSAQKAIVEQIVAHHLRIWNERQPLEEARQGISSHLVRDLVANLERYAPLLKHPSFAGEREWRLISSLIGERAAPDFIHVASATGMKQFQSFSLLTPEFPIIRNRYDDDDIRSLSDEAQGFRPIIGPNVDPDGMIEAVQTLTPREFGRAYRTERTASPYR